MNEQFKQPISGFEGLPQDLLLIARTTVEGAREVISTANEAASKGTERWHHAALANYSVVHQIADKCLENFASNVEASFEAARVMAASKTFPEASAVYRDFLRELFATSVSQTKDLCTLSSRLVRSAAATDR